MHKFLWLLLVGVIGVGCPCSRPPPDGCAPHEYSCRNGRPQVCSPERHWMTIGDVCDAPNVCCNTSSYGQIVTACIPQEACLPQTLDAGVQE